MHTEKKSLNERKFEEIFKAADCVFGHSISSEVCSY